MHDLQPSNLFNLYEVAHSESAVDNVDKFVAIPRVIVRWADCLVSKTE
jgi:hypothetical protein